MRMFRAGAKPGSGKGLSILSMKGLSWSRRQNVRSTRSWMNQIRIVLLVGLFWVEAIASGDAIGG